MQYNIINRTVYFQIDTGASNSNFRLSGKSCEFGRRQSIPSLYPTLKIPRFPRRQCLWTRLTAQGMYIPTSTLFLPQPTSPSSPGLHTTRMSTSPIPVFPKKTTSICPPCSFCAERRRLKALTARGKLKDRKRKATKVSMPVTYLLLTILTWNSLSGIVVDIVFNRLFLLHLSVKVYRVYFSLCV